MGMYVIKDISYLQAFSRKTLREVKMILGKGFDLKDIDRFLEEPAAPESSRRLPKGYRTEYFKRVKWGKRRS